METTKTACRDALEIFILYISICLIWTLAAISNKIKHSEDQRDNAIYVLFSFICSHCIQFHSDKCIKTQAIT